MARKHDKKKHYGTVWELNTMWGCVGIICGTGGLACMIE